MTFYNVISGILFLGTCQVFLANLGTPVMWYATILVATTLNESALTSELIERTHGPVDYTLGMKFIDFLTFGILAWALLVLSPARNVFDIDVSRSVWGSGRPRYFFLLLVAYWLLTLCWNALAKQLRPTVWQPWFLRIMKMTWSPFAILAIVTWSSPGFDTLWPGWGVIATIAVSGYMLLKLFAAV
jgi:hypothetical protein